MAFMRNAASLLAVASLVLLAGCGSSVIVGGNGGSPTTTGTGAVTGTGGSAGAACPTVEPTGGSCAGSPEGLRCTYGDQTRPECRDEWLCSAGTWTTTKSACAMSTACGSTQPTPGTDCPMDGAVCTYGSTLCICSQCPGGPCMAPPAKWECAGPPTGPGCPAVAPNAGTPCGAAGAMCTYGFICGGSGVETQCTSGLWVWNDMVACAN